MTTRALLRFVDDTPAVSGVAQVYKHADGDPRRLLVRLQETARAVEAADAVRGPGYAAAQFVYLDKRESATPPGPLFGHAVVDTRSQGRHDEAYRYRVTVGGDEGDGDWQVEVSERRGFDPCSPFQRTRWQFSGPLSSAVATFGE